MTCSNQHRTRSHIISIYTHSPQPYGGTKADAPAEETDLVALPAPIRLLELEVEYGVAAVIGGELLAELVECILVGLPVGRGRVLDDDLGVVLVERVDDVFVLVRELQLVERRHTVARGLHTG